MHIRPLTAQDEPFLWKASLQAIYVGPGSEPLDPEIMLRPEHARYVERWMERPCDLGYGAETEDGQLIGAAWIRCWSSDARGFGYVTDGIPELSISVSEGYRDHGVGTALIRRLLATASESFEAVSLSVFHSNPARHLYEREGFRVHSGPVGGSFTMLKTFALGDQG